MTKFFPPDEDNLISFLQQYRPTPPVNENLEEQLMTRVRQRRCSRRKPHPIWWGLSGAIAVGAILVWGGDRLRQRESLAVSSDELETFLVNSWTNSLGQTNTSNFLTPNSNWTFSSERPKQYLSSHPQYEFLVGN